MAGIRRYTVRGTAEETDCDWCGTPLDNGDEAWTDPELGLSYCAPACAVRAAKARAANRLAQVLGTRATEVRL